MTDTLLRSRRQRMLDESEPLAGLLRKCLLLGAETGSVSLRDWARKELNGYGDEDEAPEYRRLSGDPISMDSTSGSTWATGQTISRFQLPQEAWEYVPDTMSFKQPVEELEQMAGQKSLSFSSPGLSMAQSIWNRQLGPFQSIHSLSYTMTGAVVAGMVGQIRTQLVDIIADLTADTPLSELPSKGRVDAAVSEHIGARTVETQRSTLPVALSRSAPTHRRRAGGSALTTSSVCSTRSRRPLAATLRKRTGQRSSMQWPTFALRWPRKRPKQARS